MVPGILKMNFVVYQWSLWSVIGSVPSLPLSAKKCQKREIFSGILAQMFYNCETAFLIDEFSLFWFSVKRIIGVSVFFLFYFGNRFKTCRKLWSPVWWSFSERLVFFWICSSTSWQSLSKLWHLFNTCAEGENFEGTLITGTKLPNSMLSTVYCSTSRFSWLLNLIYQ